MNTNPPPIAASDPSVARALVLAGGGMRVAYQAGVVKALFDDGMRFSHADGASGGTMNLAALLSGVTPDDLCTRWRLLPVKRFAAMRPAIEYLRLPSLKALGSADGLTQYVYPALGVSIERVRAATGIDATFNVCRFDDKTVVALSQAELDMPRLVAAASLPVLLPAVEADGHTWTDAVWIQDANLLSCVQRGARELWLVWCIGNTPVWRRGAFNQYVHMIEISAIGALNAELAAIADINRRIEGGETVFGHTEPIVVHIVKPEVPLPLDPDFFLGRIDAATLIDMGYRDGRRALRSRQPAPLDPSATAMREPKVGVSFRETMSGGFTLGATDPKTGGSHAIDTLAMHATIHIEDIEAFVADPWHQAELTGHIDFPPFGLGLPSESGVFGLFTPDEQDPELAYMVYEIGFRHEGKPYYLAGRKHVRLGSPFKLWGETTTLYTTLHKGNGPDDEIIGAGVLRLGVRELLNLLRTVRATQAAGDDDASRAIGRFFKFFASELFRTYVNKTPHEVMP